MAATAFVIEGAAQGDQSGVAVAGAGDVDDDGLPTFWWAPTSPIQNGDTDAGSGYLVSSGPRTALGPPSIWRGWMAATVSSWRAVDSPGLDRLQCRIGRRH